MLRIGLIPTGGQRWVAGSIVIHNLVRALALLPEKERPALDLLLGPRQSLSTVAALERLIPPARRYMFRADDRLLQKIKNSVRHAVRGEWPTSLERLSERLDLSVLYPFLVSPGPAFPRPWLGWIPDFQHKRMPEFFTPDERAGRDAGFARLVREATRVVVSSRDAYRDLMEWFPTDPHRVGVLSFVSVPPDEWYQGDPEEAVRAHGLPRKFLMYPSQFWIHKNHRLLFQAIARLRRSTPGITLVCTGSMQDSRHPSHGPALLGELKDQALETSVRCLGLLDRTTQIQLMRAAAAIVQPSLFEGWSALLEDARLLGKRVYVSDIPVHREQEPPDARFFDAGSAEALAEAIAGDWPSLAPGPDLAREAQARSAQHPRALAYARRFLSIADGMAAAC